MHETENMRTYHIIKTLRTCALLLLAFAGSTLPLRAVAMTAGSDRFTLVIDAGHGGKDPGAIGRFSREKNINLSVAKAFGQLVERNCPDVKVVYTRKTDVFIPLARRAESANEAKADLLVSIHTNALPGGKIAYGSENEHEEEYLSHSRNDDVPEDLQVVCSINPGSLYPVHRNGLKSSKKECHIPGEHLPAPGYDYAGESCRCLSQEAYVAIDDSQ